MNFFKYHFYQLVLSIVWALVGIIAEHSTSNHPDEDQETSGHGESSEFDPNLIIIHQNASAMFAEQQNQHNHTDGIWCDLELCPNKDYGPHSPYVPCDHLPLDFIECEELYDHQGNETSYKQSGMIGCLMFQGEKQGVYFGSSYCRVLSSIQCYGNRTFIRDGLPCVRYNGHYFITALLFSITLGFLGMDRFYLGHIGTAIGKLLTIGGLGFWWLADIIFLISGNLLPEDGSNWMPYI